MFRVEWRQSALDELAAAWIRADAAQRQAVTAAAPALEQRLRVSPDTEGSPAKAGGELFLLLRSPSCFGSSN